MKSSKWQVVFQAFGKHDVNETCFMLIGYDMKTKFQGYFRVLLVVEINSFNNQSE